MNWHDYKTEKPKPLSVCLVEFDTIDHKPSYRIASYFGEHETPWAFDKGWFNDGKMVLRWTPLKDILDNIKDEPSDIPIKENEDWKDRLAVEYWQLNNRIEKLEKALIKSGFFGFSDEQKELLLEQRKAMLAYRDVLFRRCVLNNVDLYKLSFNCKPAKDGEL